MVYPLASGYGAAEHSTSKAPTSANKDAHPSEEVPTPVNPEEAAKIEKALLELTVMLGRVNTGEQAPNN